MKPKIDVQAIVNGLRGIEDELSRLKERRFKVREKLKTLNGNDRMLRGKINKVIDEVLDHDKREKDLRAILRERKSEARRLNADKKEMINKLRDSRLRLKEISLPRRSLHGLRIEMETLEEKYETSDIEASEEKRVVNKIRELARDISLFEEHQRLNLEVKELNMMLDEITHELQGVYKEIDDVKVRRERLIRMKKPLIEEATQLQKERDKLKEDCGMNKEVREVEGEIRRLVEEKRSILEPLGIRDASLTPDHIEKIIKKREDTAKSAQSKLSSREPMSLEEFAALVEEGSI